MSISFKRTSSIIIRFSWVHVHDVVFLSGSTENYLLNYIELPLMAKVNVPIYSKLKAFGKLGYGVARTVPAYCYTVIWGSSCVVKTLIDFESNPSYEKWDNGLYGSLGLLFDIRSNQLFIEAIF